MERLDKDKLVHMEIYCGQLGMITEFAYCVSMNGGLPCRNAIGCWAERMDLGRVLLSRFTREELRSVFGSLPKSKIERIMDLLARGESCGQQ
jgi:hypothetical protein